MDKGPHWRNVHIAMYVYTKLKGRAIERKKKKKKKKKKKERTNQPSKQASKQLIDKNKTKGNQIQMNA